MWYNIFMKMLLKSPLHSLISKNILLLEYTGRKSGKTYSLPVNYVQVGESLLVTSSRTRTWWRSLRGGAGIKLRLQGAERIAKGEVIEEQSDVAAALGELFGAAPQMARYFNVRFGEDQKPVQKDLQAAAQSRVIVRLKPQP